jgi:hypothetical protein
MINIHRMLDSKRPCSLTTHESCERVRKSPIRQMFNLQLPIELLNGSLNNSSLEKRISCDFRLVRFVVLASIIVAWPLSVQDVSGQVAVAPKTRISINVDKESYNEGEPVVTNVSILTQVSADRARKEPIIISLYSPSDRYASHEIIPEDIETGSAYNVSHTFQLTNDVLEGTWRAVASYLDAEARAKFNVTAVTVSAESAPAPEPSPSPSLTPTPTPTTTPASVKISSDKPSYKIGETAQFRIQVEPVAREPVFVRISAPDGNVYFNEKFPPDNTGAVRLAFDILKGYPAGTWTIGAEYLDARNSLSFDVSQVSITPVEPDPPVLLLTLSPNTLRLGETTAMSVQIDPATSSGSVLFQRTVDGNTWNDIGTVKQSGSIATHRWQPRSDGEFFVRAIWMGDDLGTSKRSISNVEKLRVLPAKKELQISLVASTTQIVLGNEAAVEIHASTIAVDATTEQVNSVLLQFSQDQNVWTDISEITLTDGYGKASWIPSNVGRFYLRAFYPENEQYLAAVSNTVVIDVVKEDEIPPEPPAISLVASHTEVFLEESVFLRVRSDTSDTLLQRYLLLSSSDGVNWTSIGEISYAETFEWIPTEVGRFHLQALLEDPNGTIKSNVLTILVKERIVSQLTIDIFTQLGGKGIGNLGGGTFELGDIVQIFALVKEGSTSVQRTNVTISLVPTATDVEQIMTRHLATDARGLAVLSLNTTRMHLGSFTATASIDVDTSKTDSTEFMVNSTMPEETPIEKVTPILSLESSSPNLKLGEPLSISVKTDPPLSYVYLQVGRDLLTWNQLARVTLSEEGIGQVTWVPVSAGLLYLRAYYPSDDRYTNAESESDAVVVEEGRVLSLSLTHKRLAPGETVEAKVSFSPETSISVIIKDPDGILIAEELIVTDKNGQVLLQFALSPDAKVGIYTIAASADNQEVSADFVVDKPTEEPALEEPFVAGEVLIGLREEVDAESEEVRRIVQEAGGEIVRLIKETNTLKIRVAKGEERNATQLLERSEVVRFSSTNKYLVPTSIEIEDPEFSRQMEHYEMIQVPSVWPVTMGRGKVTVAHLDSGIDTDHPDLAKNIWTNDDSCGDAIDGDSNNYVDDCKGWNFFHSNNNVEDEGITAPGCDGHGTHLAGIIAAVSNQIGGLGISPRVTLMPLKVSGNTEFSGKTICLSTEERVSEGVIYAADNGARIITVGLGCPNNEKCDMPTLHDAFRYAHNRGALIVVPAGNEKGIDDWQDFSLYVIEVSSLDTSGELASYSNTGPGVKFVAPGSSVYSTKIDGSYGVKTGTSQAAPMVSACAALLVSVDELLSNSDIEEILRISAKDLGQGGRDDLYGYGLVDCKGALDLILEIDPGSQSLRMPLWSSPRNDTSIEISLPRELIDSRTGAGLKGSDAEFLVFVDGRATDYEEVGNTSTERILRIAIPVGAKYIEIVGTVVAPEFGAIVALVFGSVSAIGIAVTRRIKKVTNVA